MSQQLPTAGVVLLAGACVLRVCGAGLQCGGGRAASRCSVAACCAAVLLHQPGSHLAPALTTTCTQPGGFTYLLVHISLCSFLGLHFLILQSLLHVANLNGLHSH